MRFCHGSDGATRDRRPQPQGPIGPLSQLSLRAEFFAAARTIRGDLPKRYVSKELREQALAMLADYRGEQTAHVR